MHGPPLRAFSSSFMKCIDAALSPLRQMGIYILNYLNNWPVSAQSEDELLSQRFLLLSHLECLGLRVAAVMLEHALAIQQNAQLAFTESNPYAWQIEPGSGYAILK